jgi:hypothetical protein
MIFSGAGPKQVTGVECLRQVEELGEFHRVGGIEADVHLCCPAAGHAFAHRFVVADGEPLRAAG